MYLILSFHSFINISFKKSQGNYNKLFLNSDKLHLFKKEKKKGKKMLYMYNKRKTLYIISRTITLTCQSLATGTEVSI